MKPKRIMIADDDAALSRALAIRCRELGVEVTVSPDGLHAYQAILQQPPDLLILDLNMPGASGLSMCEELAADVRFAPIPIILLTGQSDEATIERCKKLGAHYAWKGLDAWLTLKGMIRELLPLDPPAARPKTPLTTGGPINDGLPHDAPRVLLIDDDAELRRALRVRLHAHGVRALEAFAGMQGYWMALKERPDAIITDYKMPDGYGNHVIRRLREHPLTQELPVFVLTGMSAGGRRDCALERTLMGVGATKYFMKPPDFAEILAALREYVPRISATPTASALTVADAASRGGGIRATHR